MQQVSRLLLKTNTECLNVYCTVNKSLCFPSRVNERHLPCRIQRANQVTNHLLLCIPTISTPSEGIQNTIADVIISRRTRQKLYPLQLSCATARGFLVLVLRSSPMCIKKLSFRRYCFQEKFQTSPAVESFPDSPGEI